MIFDFVEMNSLCYNYVQIYNLCIKHTGCIWKMEKDETIKHNWNNALCSMPFICIDRLLNVVILFECYEER